MEQEQAEVDADPLKKWGTTHILERTICNHGKTPKTIIQDDTGMTVIIGFWCLCLCGYIPARCEGTMIEKIEKVYN